MAFSHGKDGVFLVATTALQTFFTNVEFTQAAETAETTTMGSSTRTYIRSLLGAEFSVSGYFDRTATTGPDAVLQALLDDTATTAFNWRPEGTGTGKISYDFNGFLESYDTSSDFDGVVAISAAGRVSGAVTRTVQI